MNEKLTILNRKTAFDIAKGIGIRGVQSGINAGSIVYPVYRIIVVRYDNDFNYKIKKHV